MNLKKLNLTLDNLDDYNEDARLRIVRAFAAKYGFQERVIEVDSELWNSGPIWCFYMSGVDCEHYHWIMRYDIKQTNVELVSSLKILSETCRSAKAEDLLLKDLTTVPTQGLFSNQYQSAY